MSLEKKSSAAAGGLFYTINLTVLLLIYLWLFVPLSGYAY